MILIIYNVDGANRKSCGKTFVIPVQDKTSNQPITLYLSNYASTSTLFTLNPANPSGSGSWDTITGSINGMSAQAVELTSITRQTDIRVSAAADIGVQVLDQG